MRAFRSDLSAVFLDRPNRYLVRALSGGRIVEAYCPNPGRLAELLLPGCELLLERAPAATGSRAAPRKTSLTLVACRHPGTGVVVPLYATRSNALARELVLPRLFPDALEVRAEAPLGASRIDFRIDLPEASRAWLEVKTCTLIEHGVAMFPDAPTTRGLRHVEELAKLAKLAKLAAAAEGAGRARSHILFVLMGPGARRMVPNVHTDPDFAFGLLRLEGRLELHAASFRSRADGLVRLERLGLPVDLDPIRRLKAAGYSPRNVGGVYLLVLVLRRPRTVEVGGLGRLRFPEGGYVYVGSALRGLASRLGRHLRQRKRMHWHIDYLRAVADDVEGFPIVSRSRLECALARDIAAVADGEVPGFGCSDCDCRSHLYRFVEDPRRTPAFVGVLLRYRHVVSLES